MFGPGSDDPVVWYQGAGTTARNWLETDNQNSVVAWSDSAGNLVSSRGFGPYGEPSVWTGARFAYTGQIMIPEASLYYYKSRLFDPDIGRFLQTDAVGYLSDLNLYSYTENDPINNLDIMGMDQCPDDCQIAVITFSDPTGTWTTDGIGGVYQDGDLIVTASSGNAIGQIYQQTAINSVNFAGLPQGNQGFAVSLAASPNLVGRTPGCTQAGSNGLSTAADATGQAHGAVMNGGVAALKQSGQSEAAATLGRFGAPAGVGLSALSEGYGAAVDHANGMSWGAAAAIHGSGVVGSYLGGEGGALVGFAIGEAVFPAGGGIVGAVVGGIVGGYGGDKLGQAAGAQGAKLLGIC